MEKENLSNTEVHSGISEEIPREKFEEPQELTPRTVIKWSNTYKQLEILDEQGIFKTYSIRAKARRFLEKGCIEYNKEKKCYQCLPLKGYNKTVYDIETNKEYNCGFECSCQFFQRVVKKQKVSDLVCSHICALKMMLKIWNYNKKKEKDLNISVELL